MSESQLSVLSFNCWGLKFFSKDRNERIAGIAARLSQSDYDIIALQELWVYADFKYVKESVEKYLPYAKFFYSGALGAGLALFSRFPILETSIHPYSLNGAPIDVVSGDWFVGKAAASIVINHPALGEVQIFNTHFFAGGGEEGTEYHRAHRLVNAWEFAKLAKQAAQLGRHVIAAGDFNSIPTSLPMTIIRDLSDLHDSWSVTHPNTSLLTSATDTSPAQAAITKYGVTADSPLNTYTAGKALDAHASRYMGKRLDYIFYRQPVRPHSGTTLRCKECKVVLTERVPGYDVSLSDHFGVEATFEFLTSEDTEDASRFSPTTSRQGTSSRRAQYSSSLSIGSVTEIILALSTSYQFSRRRSRRELSVFTACLGLLLVLIIGSAWLPFRWLNPIFLLLTIFVSWLATTMLYEGFVYGHWERNALTSALEDLEIYKKVIESG